MPETFFSIVWPLVFILIILAGLIVCFAALATLTMAIARTRSYTQGKAGQTAENAEWMDRFNHPGPISNPHAIGLTDPRLGAVETHTTDGIHFTPIL